MNGNIKYKLSDEALDMVTGGTGGGAADNSPEYTMHVCPNKNCPSYNKKTKFWLYGGGRAYCSDCNIEINL